MMRRGSRFLFVAVSTSLAVYAAAAEPPAETCERIRAKIGLLPLADPELLRTLAARQDCRFTASEVYRAAYGDKPLPKDELRRGYQHDKEDDD